PRLGDELIDAPGVDRVEEAPDVGVGGQHDADDVRLLLGDAREQLGARHPGHALVGDHHAHLGFGEPGERLLAAARGEHGELTRKSTRLNSSHLVISYAVFCLKKKKKKKKKNKKYSKI